ncbi:MAG: ABC transporter permease [Planctomycetota bacterium]
MIRDGLRTIRLGLKSLMLHKLRSTLTTAGILFGVASVIAMLAVGEGASEEALNRFRDMGVTNVLIRSVRPEETQKSSSSSFRQIMDFGLAYQEAERIANLLPRARVVRVREITRGLVHNEYWRSTVIVGTEPAFLSVTNMRVQEGRWLTDLDLHNQDNVCVLGASLARTLFPIENPMDQTVLAGYEDRFRVVGVLEYQGRAAGASGTTYDECLFIPLTSSRRRFGDTILNTSNNRFERVELHEVKVQAERAETVEATAAVLRELLLPKSGVSVHKDKGDIEITVPLELLRQAEASKRMFNIVLAVIASISLLVGGIGIMNVMLATVTERTREIGIRRALGAKKRHIVFQFLVEAGVLSALGGVIGVALGMVVPLLIEYWFHQTTLILVPHVVLAFGISAVVGVAFGIYPAWRAANMDPVEALRHE